METGLNIGETLVRLKILADTNNCLSAEDMQYALEEIEEILENFPIVYTEKDLRKSYRKGLSVASNIMDNIDSFDEDYQDEEERQFKEFIQSLQKDPKTVGTEDEEIKEIL